MLNILTKPPKLFFKGSVLYYGKLLARKALRRARGPEGVLKSLKRGLNDAKIRYSINDPFETNAATETSTVHVLSNMEALRYAAKAKSEGKISKLIAGPNVTADLNELAEILAMPEIDTILTASPWTKKMHEDLKPDAKMRIEIWPAGVTIPPYRAEKRKASGESNKGALHGLIFLKDAPAKLFENAEACLEKSGIGYDVLRYGSFAQKEYFGLLDKADFMIYLQQVESQGIALQEAWARNVPTLVWNKGTFTFPTGFTVKGNIAAPFLTPACGMFFGASDDLERQFAEFISKLSDFTPYEYCKKELSDEASTKRYMEIINQK